MILWFKTDGRTSKVELKKGRVILRHTIFFEIRTLSPGFKFMIEKVDVKKPLRFV